MIDMKMMSQSQALKRRTKRVCKLRWEIPCFLAVSLFLIFCFLCHEQGLQESMTCHRRLGRGSRKSRGSSGSRSRESGWKEPLLEMPNKDKVKRNLKLLKFSKKQIKILKGASLNKK